MYNTGEFVCVCLHSRLDRDLDRNPASRWRLTGTTHGVGKVIDKTGVFVFCFFAGIGFVLASLGQRLCLLSFFYCFLLPSLGFREDLLLVALVDILLDFFRILCKDFYRLVFFSLVILLCFVLFLFSAKTGLESITVFFFFQLGICIGFNDAGKIFTEITMLNVQYLKCFLFFTSGVHENSLRLINALFMIEGGSGFLDLCL